MVDWTQDNLRKGIPVIGGTQNISDQLVIHVLEPLREFLVWLPWLVVVALWAAIGWASHGWRLAVTVVDRVRRSSPRWAMCPVARAAAPPSGTTR